MILAAAIGHPGSGLSVLMGWSPWLFQAAAFERKRSSREKEQQRNPIQVE